MHAEDAALVARLLAREEAAFVALHARVHARLVALVGRIVTATAAEDVAQDTWRQVLRYLPQFDGRSRLETWIFQIGIHRARTVRARSGREVPSSSDESDPLDGSFGSFGQWRVQVAPWGLEGSPESAASNRELLLLVEQALQTLPELQRLAVFLRDVEGLDAEEVCAALGVTEGNQRILLHRGRGRIRAYVAAQLGAQSAFPTPVVARP